MQAQLSTMKFPVFSGLVIGRVYQIHSDSNTVDIILLDGSILLRVKVIANSASSRTGSTNLPLPSYKNKLMIDRQGDPLKEAEYDESDVFAIVGFLGGSLTRPICLGFIYPDENEVLCGNNQVGNEDGTMFLWKHESNTYIRVAKSSKKGESPDLEISHPSGLFIKIGETAQLTEITNWDKDLRPFKYKNPDSDEVEPVPYVHLYHPSGTSFTIDKEGSVTVYVEKDLVSTVKGNVTEEVDGDVDRVIKGNLTETIEGNVNRTVKVNTIELFEGTFAKTVKADAMETVEGAYTEHVIGDVELTFNANLDSSVGGDETRDVVGAETDHIGGAWLRQSDTSIKDEAPIINHN